MEAAANTVRRLSSASAGGTIKPHSTSKAAKTPAMRYRVALHACSRGVLRARYGRWLCWDRNRRKRRSVDPKDLRSLRSCKGELTALLRGGKGLPRSAQAARM